MTPRAPRVLLRPGPATVAGSLATAFLLLALALPLAAVAARGIADGGVEALAAVVSDPYLRERFWRTLLQASLSTLATVALGLPAALAFARWSFPGKAALRAAFTIPFVMPTVVAGAAFLATFGPRGFTGVDLTDSLALVLAVHVFYNVAIVIRIVGGFLEASAPRLREAAATLGAGPWRTVRRVTLPLAWPALAAASALVFVFCFTSFGAIAVVAPGGSWDTLEIEIHRTVSRLLRLDLAAALALIQLLATMAVAGAYVRMQARAAAPLAAPAPARRPGPVGTLVLLAALLPPTVLAATPAVALLARAIIPPGADGPSLAYLQQAFAPTGLAGVTDGARATWNSLRFAAASAAVATLMGSAFAYAVVRGGWRWLDRASLLPLATSAVTLGLGVLLAFPGLAGGFWGLAAAHAVIGTPFVARALLPSLRGVPASRSAAAATLGAGRWRRAWRVDLPAVAPALAAGAGFAAAVSLGEFGAALVLSSPDLATLPVAIFQRLSRPGVASYGTAMALAATLMVLTGVVVATIDRLAGRGEW